jgi:hypothetical protein
LNFAKNIRGNETQILFLILTLINYNEMKKRITLVTLTFILGLFSWSATSQVTVTGSVSGDGSYSTLGAAITAIPLSGQSGNNITIAISASTTEATTGITIGAGTWSSLKIYPTATATISAATPNTSTVAFITLSGANNVTIDGRLDQSGASSLTIFNSSTVNSTAGSTITFTSNAQNNTIKYCTVKGNQTGNFGVISFSATATVTNGNGLNTIDHNVITNNGTVPKYGIYAIGNTTSPNVGNQITNNEFKDLIAIYVASTTVFIAGGTTAPQNDNYTISGNSFYNGTILNYASSNLTRTMLGIGTSAAAFGGSHTITDNYIGGNAAYCSGTLTKTAKEATFVGMQIYPSPSVSGGGATSIQNNTIKNISWDNDYWVASTTLISIAGGTGDVNIGTVTGNTIGDNTTNGSITLINKGAANGNATIITIGTTGTVNCQNNKIGSITGWHKTSGQYYNMTAITKTATAGATTISNNLIGSLTTANSIYSYNSAAVAPTQSVTCISYLGTATGTVSNNTIANATNNSTTGYLYGIHMNGVGSTGTVNGNLIHSNVITGSTGTGAVIGIWSNNGTNTITNNIIKLGDDNACEIRGIGDGTAPISTSMFNNTVYLSGTPTSGAFSSTCLLSSGSATIRNYKNNILVNTRSNGGSSTSVHYALNMAANVSGTIAVDGNDYVSSGTGAVLGRYSTDKTSLPIVTDHDATSVSVSPSFANAGGTTALDYKPATGIQGVAGTGVAFDYAGTARVKGTIGAYEIPDVNTGMKTFETGVRVFPSYSAIKVIGANNGDAIEVYNSLGQKVKSLTATQSDMSISLSSKGIYMIKVGSSTNKVIFK